MKERILRMNSLEEDIVAAATIYLGVASSGAGIGTPVKRINLTGTTSVVTISGVEEGEIVIITSDDACTITANTGNVKMTSDFNFDSIYDSLMLFSIDGTNLVPIGGKANNG